eukprot:CAMPEP_0170551386 /NCGR_PEP_ID=MMETSP0211-20121228/9385_1 /TAXON_ID=311385 /ORGANISM="Pseudokeronopsis sp., Strain OXSARD2" /LENGTH=46 /DNA_ID= /DNA_START= /DNA_END= /DNA_ORIENTATION=
MKELETLKMIEEKKAELQKHTVDETLRQMKETVKTSQMQLNLSSIT